MKTSPFGWTGVPVPRIGQGTWRMGEVRRERAREVAALQLGLDLGLTHIDTAEMYGDGGAKKMVAVAIRGRRREELFIVSKVLPEHASARGTVRAADQSLRRLGLDHLDLYLLHWPSAHPIAETMGAMEQLARAGKIRFLGVSNFDVDETRTAMAALSRERLACNQVLYHLGARGIELDLIPFCREHGIAVVGYMPLRKTGGQAGAARLAEIGARQGKTAAQVTLSFLTRLPGVFTIPKAVTPAHVRENAGADFDLEPADSEAIDRAFPAPRRPVPLETA
jgi:diketogulonate reductase-like aldo/keto reductase